MRSDPKRTFSFFPFLSFPFLFFPFFSSFSSCSVMFQTSWNSCSVCKSQLSPPDDRKIDAFLSWLKENHVEFLYHPKWFGAMGMGAFLTKDVKEQETFLEVPVQIIVSTAYIQQDWADIGFTQWPEDFIMAPLIIWLMQESCKKDSTHRPYIDLLPYDFSTTPLTWCDEDLNLTEGTGLMRSTTKQRQKLEENFHVLEVRLFKPYAVHFHETSFAKFLWAYQVINSRWWEVSDENGDEGFLVPGGDLMNHKPGGGIGFFTDDFKCGFKAAADYHIGDQLFIDYGIQSNFELLSTFGFTLEENCYDSVSITLNLIEDIQTIALPGITSSQDRETVPTPALLVKLSESLLCQDLIDYFIIANPTEYNNARMDALVFLSKQIKAFTTTVEQDDMLLQDKNLPANTKNAVILRKTQKLILLSQIQHIITIASNK